MRKLTELNYIIFNKYNKIFIKNKNIFQIYRFFLKLNRDSSNIYYIYIYVYTHTLIRLVIFEKKL